MEPRSYLIVLAGTIVLASPSDGQSRRLDLLGEGSGFGGDLAVLSDVDGDALPEFVVAGAAVYSTDTQVFDGQSGLELHSLPFVGYGLAAAGDLDADGVEDVLIGGGAVYAYSGADGSELHFIPALSQYFGAAVSALDDVDGDGHDDFVASDTGYSSTFTTEIGALYVFSGATGAILDSYFGSVSYEHVGSGLAPLPDVTGDGIRDLVVYCYNSHYNNGPGLLRLHSGATLDVVWELTGGPGRLAFGQELAAGPDVNGDGTPDVVASHSTGVEVRSGADGAWLFSLTGTVSSIAIVDDLDADGVLDLAAGEVGFDQSRGRFLVVSTATGSVLLEEQGEVPYDYLGRELAAADFDGDGRRELLVGCSAFFGVAEQGDVYLYDLEEDVSLRGLPGRVSSTSGGTQTLTLDAGPAHAGEFHSIVGSLGGIHPGIPVAAGTVPLNPDWYFLQTVASPGTFVVNAIGLLDGAGRATASIPIPADPALTGYVGHHAYVTMTFGPFAITDVSNPVSLRLLP